MEKLTKREEQIMHILWQLENAFVKEIIAHWPEAKKPHYNTISTILGILAEKKFVSHRSLGNSHQYYPVIQKEDYQKRAIKDVLRGYFDNSYPKMVAYFAKEEKISETELAEIIDLIKNKKS